jgi:hypothetical protein
VSAISHGGGQRLRLSFDSFIRYTSGEEAECARVTLNNLRLL